MEPVLEVKNLTKVFPNQGRPAIAAVSGVSFQIFPGEWVALIGESGSGKSTIAQMVTRLLQPTQGSIFLNGEDITAMKGAPLKSVYQKIQMVFQTPAGSFDPRRTLGDGIGESLRNSGMSRPQVQEYVIRLLSQCGLDSSFAKYYPHEASGGQCQRAAIARALAIRPALLVCDEITSALDVTVQAQIMELLQSVQKQTKMAYLFISHDLALVQQFSHRILVLQQGKLVEAGTPDEIIFHPKEAYTRQFIESAL